MRALICFLVLSVNFIQLFGQQMEQYSLYNTNNYLINPAVGGAYSYWNAKVGFRNQWRGLEDNANGQTVNASPRTLFASVHGPIGHPELQEGVRKKKQHHGVGASIFSDVTGSISYQGIYGSYAYFAQLNKDTKISFGAGLGLKSLSINTSDFYFVQDRVDDLIGEQEIQTSYAPDLNVGIWLDNKSFFGGVSMKQLLRNKLSFTNTSDDLANDVLLKYHYYFTAGYILQLSKDWFFSPSIMTRVVYPAPAQTDVNLRVMHSNSLSLGINYRHKNAISAMCEYVFNDKIELAYAFDYTTSEIRRFSNNTHEIIMGIRIGNKKKPVLCPSEFW